MKEQGKEADLSKWWFDEESKVYQFIGEDNIYFYAIAQTGLFTGLQVPKGEVPDMEKVHLSHIIANRHLLYMDTKAGSSSELKPPMADATNDAKFRKQLIIDCFYACKVMAILIHPIAPEGCEMFREYLNLGEELWDWSNIFEPVSFYIADAESHKLKYLKRESLSDSGKESAEVRGFPT